MGDSYSDEMTIERIDVNGNYEKENCCWISRGQQRRNLRNNLIISFGGKKQLLVDWSKELGINYQTLHSRLYLYHWPVKVALEPRHRKYNRLSS